MDGLAALPPFELIMHFAGLDHQGSSSDVDVTLLRAQVIMSLNHGSCNSVLCTLCHTVAQNAFRPVLTLVHQDDGAWVRILGYESL